MADSQFSKKVRELLEEQNKLLARGNPVDERWSNGIFERLLILEFNCPIPEKNRDPHLESKIKNEIETEKKDREENKLAEQGDNAPYKAVFNFDSS